METSVAVSNLSDLLNSQPVSARQAAAAAEDKGIKLPYGTIAGYWAGKHGRPSARTLESLAAVLPLSLGQLQTAAWGKATKLGEYRPPREADLLDARQRRALDELIRSIVAAKEAGNEDQGTQNPQGDPATDGEAGTRGTPMNDERRQSDFGLVQRNLPGPSRGEQLHRDVQAAGEESQDHGHDDPA